MPIAVSMQDAPPTSPRMTKAAFFRARSPPVLDRTSATGTARAHSPNDLAARFHAQPNRAGSSKQSNPRYSPDASEEIAENFRRHQFLGEADYAGSEGTLGHTPNLSQQDAITNPAYPAGGSGGRNGKGRSSASPSDDRQEIMSDQGLGLTRGGSDEMLMSLLAGQAVMDCETLPVGGWEEVESWKKELALLSTRLDSLIARHQREIKILTAARTLQKLNTANKRMSKQTTESLEQAEKRADAAEREVLSLKEREADLRRRLMEHWSGVMAWEVRRLEKVSSDAQARFNRQSRQMGTTKERETDMLKQIGDLETHLDRSGARIEQLESEMRRRSGKVKELEEMVLEMGRRERGIEEEFRDLEKVKRGLEAEKEQWEGQRRAVTRDAQGWEAERAAWLKEKEEWALHKRSLAGEMDRLMKDRQRMLDAGRTSERDKAVLESLKYRLGSLLGRGVQEDGMDAAMDEVKSLLSRRSDDVRSLREEMKEVNMGLENEIRRVSSERDNWRNRAEKIEQAQQTHYQEQIAAEKKIRTHVEQISDLTLRNDTLSSSLAAAQAAVTDMSSSSAQVKTLQTRCDSLTNELETIAGQFNEVWTILPPLSRRVDAQLATPEGTSLSAAASPNRSINFAALQQLYTPSREEFAGIDEMLGRVRGLVDDGKVLVERVVRLGQEREMYKSNAAKAKKLVEDSRNSLETYQQQVAVLEDRLAKSGSTESHFLEELNSVRSALDKAQIAKRNVEAQVKTQSDTVTRLEKANAELSSRALGLAEEAESKRADLQRKLESDLEAARAQMDRIQEDADDERARGQAQRIQLLDELNSLQAEVGELRKQLRLAKGGK